MEGVRNSSNGNDEISVNMNEKMPNAKSKSETHVKIISAGTSDSNEEEKDMYEGQSFLKL